ncbi:MAG: TetR/AcrR family transcriptional regulator [Phycisphaerales bacterium JB059]
MPSEKSFKESDIVNQAMQIFWEKGYAGASISDITEATGIKRGSLYNAFDGKGDLFLQSLFRYEHTRLTQRLAQLDKIDDPREAIAAFFDSPERSSEPEACSGGGSRGCLLVNTLFEYAHHDPEIQRAVSDALGEVVSFFERRIRQGQREGVIPASVEAQGTAQALFAYLVGLRVLGRGAKGPDELRPLSTLAMRLLGDRDCPGESSSLS